MCQCNQRALVYITLTLVRNSGVYVFARGPVGGFSGVYLPVRTPELWEQISAGNEIGKQ
jgi:hypothetical protein